MTPAITLQHLRSLQAVNPVEITITRGSETCPLTAAPARTTDRVMGGDGVLSRVKLKDWLIAAEDFTLDSPAYPQRGDVIEIVDSGKQYIVTHPDATQKEIDTFGDCEPAVGWKVHSVEL